MKASNWFFIPIALALTACGAAVDTTGSRVANNEGNSKVGFVSSRPSSNQKDPIVRNAQVVGDRLLLDITYTGGCQPHSFSFDIWEGFLESYPVQTYAALADVSEKDDSCKALVREQVTISLAPLANRYRVSYLESSGRIVLQIAGYGAVTYAFGPAAQTH